MELTPLLKSCYCLVRPPMQNSPHDQIKNQEGMEITSEVRYFYQN